MGHGPHIHDCRTFWGTDDPGPGVLKLGPRRRCVSNFNRVLAPTGRAGNHRPTGTAEPGLVAPVSDQNHKSIVLGQAAPTSIAPHDSGLSNDSRQPLSALPARPGLPGSARPAHCLQPRPTLTHRRLEFFPIEPTRVHRHRPLPAATRAFVPCRDNRHHALPTNGVYCTNSDRSGKYAEPAHRELRTL